MIQKKRAIVFGLFLGVLLILPGVAAQAQNPTLLKRTISVTARRWSRYWKNPKAANGQITDNGWAAQNQLGLPILLLPVKVLGDQDGMWDAAAWKTEAFYGNPLTGFNIP